MGTETPARSTVIIVNHGPVLDTDVPVISGWAQQPLHCRPSWGVLRARGWRPGAGGGRGIRIRPVRPVDCVGLQVGHTHQPLGGDRRSKGGADALWLENTITGAGRENNKGADMIGSNDVKNAAVLSLYLTE